MVLEKAYILAFPVNDNQINGGIISNPLVVFSDNNVDTHAR